MGGHNAMAYLSGKGHGKKSFIVRIPFSKVYSHIGTIMLLNKLYSILKRSVNPIPGFPGSSVSQAN